MELNGLSKSKIWWDGTKSSELYSRRLIDDLLELQSASSTEFHGGRDLFRAARLPLKDSI